MFWEVNCQFLSITSYMLKIYVIKHHPVQIRNDSNARAKLHQSNEPGLFDHLLVNDDLENLKVIHPDHLLPWLDFFHASLQLWYKSFLNNCYCNMQKLLSLDDDQEDSDDFRKFDEIFLLSLCIDASVWVFWWWTSLSFS